MTASEKRLCGALAKALDALSEWPMGWHNDKASGRAEFEVAYTVAKARRMERLYGELSAVLAEESKRP